MKQFIRSTVLVWGLRVLAITVIALQVWAIATGAPSIIEALARIGIIVGCAITLRAERLGGAVMILGCALLSIAIYGWTGALGSFGSTLLAFHTLPPMVIGVLYLFLPLRVERMQPAMALES